MTSTLTSDSSAQPEQFRAYHEPALEFDEVRHGLILSALARVNSGKPIDLRCWTLGEPGECAIKMGHHAIVLGALAQDQCRRLADLTARMDYPGVVGPEMTARWFTDRAGELGIKFLEPVPQQIYSITDKPRFPGAGGSSRSVGERDAALLADWLVAFYRDAVPQDRLPPREELERAADEDRFLFWIANGQPVSMAGIVRRLKQSAAITGVYTPPELRGRGYAGSVTAATVERIYAEGRKIACLYADLRNSASNRCYTKIGFTPLVLRIDLEEGELSVDFDGREVIYGFGELDELVLAYATTIHKSQGSEYPAVVIALSTQHYPMLQRNLVYTGVTRGKRLVVIIGQRQALAIAMKGARTRKRWSKLRDWLRGGAHRPSDPPVIAAFFSAAAQFRISVQPRELGDQSGLLAGVDHDCWPLGPAVALEIDVHLFPCVQNQLRAQGLSSASISLPTARIPSSITFNMVRLVAPAKVSIIGSIRVNMSRRDSVLIASAGIAASAPACSNGRSSVLPSAR